MVGYLRVMSCTGLTPLCFGMFHVLFFQILSSCKAWAPFLVSSPPNFRQILSEMLQSRANSTTKAYLRVIKRFLGWCKSKKLIFQLPFSVSTVSLNLFEIHQSYASSASLIQAHATLKWLHSFVPSLDRNPLDSEFCKNIIESAKRIKSKPVAKKKPFSSHIIKKF